MSFSITETDVWPGLRRKIEGEISECVDGLRHVPPENLIRQQSRIEALEWVLDQSKPKRAIQQRQEPD